MIYELEDTSKVVHLFEGWDETLIASTIQKVMGKIYVTDLENPVSAFSYVGCFGFLAGKVDEELIQYIPDSFVILTPQNELWEKAIEKVHPGTKRITRYAIRKDTKFDQQQLNSYLQLLPDGYEIHSIDSYYYDQCLENDFTEDFVSSFSNKEEYLKWGRGVVITKEGKIVAGASSYTRYLKGIEIEVDTKIEERRKHLALVACAKLILECLEEGLYPSWDAANQASVALSKKLGYELSHEYICYEVEKSNGN